MVLDKTRWSSTVELVDHINKSLIDLKLNKNEYFTQSHEIIYFGELIGIFVPIRNTIETSSSRDSTYITVDILLSLMLKEIKNSNFMA